MLEKVWLQPLIERWHMFHHIMCNIWLIWLVGLNKLSATYMIETNIIFQLMVTSQRIEDFKYIWSQILFYLLFLRLFFITTYNVSYWFQYLFRNYCREWHEQ